MLAFIFIFFVVMVVLFIVGLHSLKEDPPKSFIEDAETQSHKGNPSTYDQSWHSYEPPPIKEDMKTMIEIDGENLRAAREEAKQMLDDFISKKVIKHDIYSIELLCENKVKVLDSGYIYKTKDSNKYLIIYSYVNTFLSCSSPSKYKAELKTSLISKEEYLRKHSTDPNECDIKI